MVQLVQHRLQFIWMETSMWRSVSCVRKVTVVVRFVAVVVVIMVISIIILLLLLVIMVTAVVMATVGIVMVAVVAVAMVVCVVHAVTVSAVVVVVIVVVVVVACMPLVVGAVIFIVVVFFVVPVAAVIVVMVGAAERCGVVVQLMLQSADLPLQELLQRAGVGDGRVPLLLRGQKHTDEVLMTMAKSSTLILSFFGDSEKNNITTGAFGIGFKQASRKSKHLSACHLQASLGLLYIY